jgi:hypothetical protein
MPFDRRSFLKNLASLGAASVASVAACGLFEGVQSLWGADYAAVFAAWELFSP